MPASARGTQLALAIGTALMRLEGLTITPQQIGDLAGRGARSAIGIAAFEGGGFIVDGGRGKTDHPPPVLAADAFSGRLARHPRLRPQGSGRPRRPGDAGFRRAALVPDAKAQELCRLVLMQLLPGLKETDIAAFGAALTRIQEIVGGHFAAAQGGSPWTSPTVGKLVQRLHRRGRDGYRPDLMGADRLRLCAVGGCGGEPLSFFGRRGYSDGPRNDRRTGTEYGRTD